MYDYFLFAPYSISPHFLTTVYPSLKNSSLQFLQPLSAPILLYLLLSTAAKILTCQNFLITIHNMTICLSTFFLFPFPLFIITLSTYIRFPLPLNSCFSTISHTPLSLPIIPLFCSHLTHSLSPSHSPLSISPHFYPSPFLPFHTSLSPPHSVIPHFPTLPL